jgi:hypothetical protein
MTARPDQNQLAAAPNDFFDLADFTVRVHEFTDAQFTAEFKWILHGTYLYHTEVCNTIMCCTITPHPANCDRGGHNPSLSTDHTDPPCSSLGTNFTTRRNASVRSRHLCCVPNGSRAARVEDDA